MAKTKIPTTEEIEALKSDFRSELDTINKAEREGKSSPKRNFLSSISAEIKSSLDSGTSYIGIKTAIKRIYNVDVSTQIIADFAHSELGIAKRKKSTPSSAEPVKNEVFIEEAATPIPVAETPKKLSIKEQRRANAKKAKEENIR